MPDFTGVRAAAEDAVRQPEFATVERRAARLRLRHRVGAGAGAAALAVAVAAAGGQLLTGGTGTPAGPDVSATQPPTGLVVGDAVAGDATHLYVVVATEPCSDTTACHELHASDDGGQTWQVRPMPSDDPGISWIRPTAIGPQTLVMVGRRSRAADGSLPLPSPSAQPEGFAVPPHVSVDGGATWRPVSRVDTPVSTVPDGGVLVDPVSMHFNIGPAALVLDPATATIAPLANQPPIRVMGTSPPAATGMWVTGWDPASRKPAVSVTRDRGQNWHTRVFTEGSVPEVPDGQQAFGYWPQLDTRDGQMVYVSFYGDSAQFVYRSIDGGLDWVAVPVHERGLQPGFVAADGGYMVTDVSDEPWAYLVSRDGGPFQPASISGLPEKARPIQTAPDGTYFTYGDNTFYLSDDGYTYDAVPIG